MISEALLVPGGIGCCGRCSCWHRCTRCFGPATVLGHAAIRLAYKVYILQGWGPVCYPVMFLCSLRCPCEVLRKETAGSHCWLISGHKHMHVSASWPTVLLSGASVTQNQVLFKSLMWRTLKRNSVQNKTKKQNKTKQNKNLLAVLRTVMPSCMLFLCSSFDVVQLFVQCILVCKLPIHQSPSGCLSYWMESC